MKPMELGLPHVKHCDMADTVLYGLQSYTVEPVYIEHSQEMKVFNVDWCSI